MHDEYVPPGEKIEVLVEAPPMWGGNNRAITQRVEELLRKVFPDAHWANPGQWKNTPASRTPVPRGLTQHEKDVIRFGRWYLSTRRHGAGPSSS